MEEALQKCRETVGRPIVQACMGGGRRVRGGGGNFEACRAQARPKVFACVQAAMKAANGRATAPAAAKLMYSGWRSGKGDFTEPESNSKLQSRGSVNSLQLRPTAFVPPPRTISDITAILDQEKPDSERLAKLRALADSEPPAPSDPSVLANFYYNRANARFELGRAREAIADGEHAIEIARGKLDIIDFLRTTLAYHYQSIGEVKNVLKQYNEIMEQAEIHPKWRANIFFACQGLTATYLELGDFTNAERFVQKSQESWKSARSYPGYQSHALIWEARVETTKGHLLWARGHLNAALDVFKHAETLVRRSIEEEATTAMTATGDQKHQAADRLLLYQADIKARQGRLVEAEGDARRALLGRLRATGKYHSWTASFIVAVGRILIEQGRFDEAEKLITAAVDIDRTLDVPQDSQIWATTLTYLGAVRALQGHWIEAAESYDAVERATEAWDPARRDHALLSSEYIETQYKSQRVEAGLAAATRLLNMTIARLGEQHPQTAAARGMLAIGLSLATRDDEALREFKSAVPILAAASNKMDTDDPTSAAARTQRIRTVIESYIALIARTQASETADESFRLGDVLRGSSVQRALAASSARAATQDPALSELARKAQDLDKQVSAQLGVLNNVLTLPPEQRDGNAIKVLEAEIEKLRTEREAARREITNKYPEYANLLNPPSPNAADIRDILHPDEAMLSFYFGREKSFVWVVPKQGPIAFAEVNATFDDIATKVSRLRKTLEPTTGLLSLIPPFDLNSAFELYTLLLRPVETAWRPAKKLIVVTNGALGLLPLSLLPTAPSQVSPSTRPYFADYREVPWLARNHAVTMVPSASTFLELRRLPPGSQQREKFVGFGDPIFSKQQEADEAKQELLKTQQVAAIDPTGTVQETRGPALNLRPFAQTRAFDSAQLGVLPPLPDTALELKSIALALEADPLRSLYLGKEANEQNVKKLELSRFKVVAFSTHGLVPGDLDGLTQPALALTAPDVAGIDGDGLLTMEEIFGLKLDADWVVLSACNTATGAAAGAEAISGLGSAFFYAGTRALLVTNWSVDSVSARELVSDLFRRQSHDPKLTRGEALRQAMMALLDSDGFVDEGGKTQYTYGHPLFWAPYSIVGDGG
jgi:CHAT domain-containing protein